MKVIAVDDESISLECMEVVLETIDEIDEVFTFSDAQSTIEWLSKSDKQIEAAFLDIEMWGTNGLKLAAEIKKLIPSCKIIFCTSSPKYALDAFQIHANGYIVKPITAEAIKKELEYFNASDTPENNTTQSTEKVRVQCFGNFDVFYKDHNIKFGLSKAKELFAYLIHRKGALCSTAEIASVLFENRTDSDSLQSQVRNMISNMKKSLEQAGVDTSNFIIKQRGYISINANEVKCDYYDFLDGDPASINLYNGEYMSQYSWSEFTVGYLERQINK